MLDRITPLILTFNEAPNIGRTLERLSWARDIVVVDSGSTDATREILRRYPRVRVFERPFTKHAEQWNFGLGATGISTDWVLALDADYILSEAFVEGIAALNPGADTDGYRATFTYCIEGKPLRGAAYPPVVVLFRRAGAIYVQDGHTQRIQVQGRVLQLIGPVYHDDRKPLAHWLSAQASYMRFEAEKLHATTFGDLGFVDRLRCFVVIAPLAMFFYCLVMRGGLLDGRAGLFYALQRATAEIILSLYLIEGGLGRRGRDTNTR